MRNHQRRSALWPWPALAQALPWSFRPIFLTRRLITAPRFRLSHLFIVSTPPSRCRNTAPASSGAPSSMKPLLHPKSRFITELAFLHFLGAWRFLTPAPHRLSSDEVFWIACTRLVLHPSHVSRNAPLVLGGGVGESAPLKTSTRVRLSVQIFRERSLNAPWQFGPAWSPPQ